MPSILEIIKRSIITVDMPLIRIVNLFGIIYLVVWIVGLGIVFAGGLFENQFMIYYIVPLLLAYYSFYLRIKANEKLSQIDDQYKTTAKTLKISENEAREYLRTKIENELFVKWVKFNILVFVVVALIVGMFYI